MGEVRTRVGMAKLWGLGALLVMALVPDRAMAGVPECNGIRLEDAQGCELRGSLDCEAGCSDVKFQLACSASLHAECRGGCSVEPEIGCTDDCSAVCKEQCDFGIDIQCTHNCFNECQGVCGEECRDADDPKQCRASCEATCDGECDTRCESLVDAPCYTHCQECCHGSCTAQLNMDCQIECQTQAFAECETDFKGECAASCEGDGAIFCDGEYIASGDQAAQCAAALATRGMAEIDAAGDVSTSGGCSLGPSAPAGSAPLLALLLVGLGASQRRRPARRRR